MTRSMSEEFWALVCDFRDLVVILWSFSVLCFILSAALLMTDVTDQDAILTLNLIVFAVPLTLSFVILRKCKERA